MFTFEAIKEHGSVALKTTLADLDRVEAIGEREVCFVTRQGAEINPIMPFAYGGVSIQAQHYWTDRDISRTTTEPALGAGRTVCGKCDFGRRLVYERVRDYWGAELPANRGPLQLRHGEVRLLPRRERDAGSPQGRRLRSARGDGVQDQYAFPAVQAGMFKAQLRYITRVWGLWWPIFWNFGAFALP